MPNPSRRVFIAAAASLAWCPCAIAAPGADPALAAAIAAARRSSNFVKRDRYRHPAALLEFFGLQPTQSVLEIQPGGGYWTEILAPYLAPHGRYTVALDDSSPVEQREAAAFHKKLAADPSDYGKVNIVPLSQGSLGPAGGYDLILSFRNLHDWLEQDRAPQVLARIFAALKPGGVFGIEDHRAPATAPQDPKAKSGYVRQDYATKLIEAAGFRLTASSEIGANPKDTKIYPDGVWDLPPALRQGAKDRAKYLAIGESDRWTLKFIKP